MKSHICLIALLLVSLTAVSQTVQTGFVKEYNEELAKTPLENVELVITNAGTAVSDSDGSFSLVFRTLHPGSHVSVRRIEKLGYEVFNNEALEQWNINPDCPFTIVMCRSDKFKKIRDNYSALSSKSYAEQKAREENELKRKLDEGLIQKAEYEDELRRIIFDYEEKLESLDVYIDKFARIDLSEISDEEYEIIKLIQAGDFEQAISRYESMNLLELYSKEVADVKELEADIDRLSVLKARKLETVQDVKPRIFNQINLYKLAGGRENYAKIALMLKTAADADTTSLDFVWEYASFCLEQKDYDEAMEYFCIYDRNCSSLSDKAAVNNFIGKVYHSLNDYDRADEYLTLSIMQYEALDSPKLINVYLDQAALYSEMRCFTRALEIFQEVLDSYAGNPSDSEGYCSRFAEACFRVGETLFLMNRITEAEEMLVKSYQLYEDLYEAFPDKYLSSLARNRLYLAQIFRMSLRYDEAGAMFDEVLDNYRILYEKNPNAYQYDYAIALGKSAVLYRELSRMNEVAECSEKSLELIDGLYSLYADAYKPDKMRMLVNVAEWYRSSGRYSECEAVSCQVLEECEDLYARYPEVFGFDMARSSSNLATIYVMQHKYSEAESFFLKAYDYLYPLYEKDPDIYLNDMRMVYNNLGAFYDVSKFDLAESERYHMMALELVERLCSAYPGIYDKEKMTTYSNLSLLYSSLDRLEEAADCSERAFDIAAAIYRNNPDVGRGFLIARNREKASVYSSLGNKEVEEKCYREVLRLTLESDKENVNVYYKSLANACKELGYFLLIEADISAAAKYLTDGYGYIEILFDMEPEAYRSDMSLWNAIMFIYYMEVGDSMTALNYALKAFELDKVSYAQTPKRFWYQYMLSCQRMAEVYSSVVKDFEKAEQYDKEAVALMDKYAGGMIEEYIVSYERLCNQSYMSGRTDLALEYLDKLFAIDESPAYLVFKAEILYETGHIEESVSLFSTITENHPGYLDEKPSEVYDKIIRSNE